jgi:hypothetical protein
VECYWAALTRDIAFADHESDATIAVAAADLSAQPGYRGPRSGGAVKTSPSRQRAIFSGRSPSCCFTHCGVPAHRLRLHSLLFTAPGVMF